MVEEKNKSKKQLLSELSELRQRIAQLEASETERNQEEAPWVSFDWLGLAQRAANAGFWNWDMVTGQLTWSEGFYQLFGLAPGAEPSFETWHAVLHPDDREQAMTMIHHSITERIPLKNECRITLSDGQERWINALGNTFYDETGQPLRMCGICIDVTDRKRMEEALRQSEQLYRAIGESIDYGVWVCAPDGRNIYASESFLKMVGLTQQQCSDFGWGDVLHPDDADRTIASWKECVRTGGTWDIEHRFLGVDGQWHHVLARGVPVRDAQGEITCWAGINLDIKSLKQAQEALRKARDDLEMRVHQRTIELKETNEALQVEIEDRIKAEEAVKVERQRLSDVLGILPVYVILLTPDYQVPFANSFFEERFGVSHGRRCFEYLFGRKEPCETCETYKVLKTNAPHHWEWIGPDSRNYDIYDFPFTDTDGSPLIMEVGIDITERKLTEAQLRQAQKMEALGTLSGGIAHDFNNILAAIIGFSEMVHDDLPDGSKEKRHLDRVLKAGLRGRELVRQMLTFSRKTEQDKKPLLVSSVITESIQLLRASLPTTISMQVDVKSESGLILADPVQIQQVVMNLCTNAAHAMREQGGALVIQLSDYSVPPSNGSDGMKPGLYMKLTVRDTGTGIAPEIRDRIFDPFFTTKKVGEGSGLGLSVVHGIVKQSDGYITVESEPGKGSTFTLYFPKVAAGPVADGVSDDDLPTGFERILFIDDEEALVEMGEELLAELGYAVVSRTSSKEALDLLKNDPSRFDLVITDQTMPDMTGIELARKVLPIRPDIPIILCTGFSHLVDADVAKEAGIRAFVMKPLTKRELARSIRKVLDA